jgi:hypothetical protein
VSPDGDENAWRFALASVVGSSHGRSGTPCQDASACEIVERADASFVVAVVSDGAGSARHAQIGSRLACQVVREGALEFLASGADLDHALLLLERFQVVIARAARRMHATPRDFACTLLFALLGPRAAAFGQIGDGAIVISPGQGRARSGFDWVFWPQRGEYANQTSFATQPDAAQNLAFEHWPHPVHELALLSDGLQSLVLDLQAKTAHARFFAPMFATVRRARPGPSPELSAALERYLRSDTVQRRTDDDTTLILVSRGTPEPLPALPKRPVASPQELESHEETR